MLLQKIRLKGFLGHRTHEQADGANAFSEIDLSTGPLWLIHGPNGGGKSSLWDAVAFAMFKEHRGGGRNFEQLIHDADDKAEIELEFTLECVLYMIQSTITRAKRKGASAKPWGIVRRWNGKEWESVPGTEKKVEQWVSEKLRMKYDTFCSAVLLRQGEADRFIRAKAKERLDCLMELLQLDFYRLLDQKTTTRKNQCSKDLERCEQSLRELNAPTAEQVESQRRLTERTVKSLSLAENKVEEKKAELADAERSTILMERINRAQRQQQDDETLFAEAETIHRDARDYRELGSKVLPRLDSLWSARGRLSREDQALKQTEADASSLKQSHALMSDRLETLREDERQAAQTFSETQAAYEQLMEQQQKLQRSLAAIAQIESFEHDIHKEEKKLESHRQILEMRKSIERDYQRYNDLREAEPLLDRLERAAGKLADAQTALESARRANESSQQSAQEANEEETRLRKLSEQAAQLLADAREESRQHQLGIEKLQVKLEKREGVAGDTECPTCGSQLNSEEARARLSLEITRWHEEISALQEKQLALEANVQEQESVWQRAQADLDAAALAARDAHTLAVRAHNSFDNARSNLTQAEAEFVESRIKAGDWAEKVEEVEDLRSELQGLRAVPADWSMLEKAMRAEASVNATIENYQSRLALLPGWSAKEREGIKEEAEKCARHVSRLSQQRDEAERAHKEAFDRHDKAEREYQQMSSDLTSFERQVENLRQRIEEAEEELAQKRAELLPEWLDDPASEDATALEALRLRFESLREAEERENELRAAESRRAQLDGEIGIYRTELGDIPPERQRASADVKAELATANQMLEQARVTRREAEKRLLEVEHQLAAAERLRQERDEATREFSYYKRLADAFGKHGLQAVIVQRAQEDIKRHANTILGRLSGNAWQIELKENEAHTELEIQARALSQPGTPTRSFEYLSGGEQFLVAISLAVAIGQSVTGGRTADTLMIDEGFGTLDESNRRSLVRELNTLSEEVLRGGRVVVVSHQEDVCGEFGNRYRINKDDGGYVQVERNSLS